MVGRARRRVSGASETPLAEEDPRKRPSSNHHSDGKDEGAGVLRAWQAAIVVAVLSLVLYSNTLDGGFVYDDARGVVANPDVVGGGPYSNLLVNDFWGVPMALTKSHKSYRPLTVLTFRLNHDVHGLQPFGYHLVNVMLHAVASALVVVVCRQVLRCSEDVSFSTALLFATHAVHTEAVANLVGRADVLCCVMFLLTIIAYHRLRLATGAAASVAWGGLVAACTAAAMLAKEQGLMVIAVCGVLDVVVGCGRTPWSVLQALQQNIALRWRFVFLAALGVALLGLRVVVMQGSTPTFNPLELPAAFSPDLTTRVLTLNYLVVFNFKLLVFPWRLCNDWAFGSIPLVESLGDSRALETIVFYIVLAAAVLLFTSNFPADNLGKLKQRTLVTMGLALMAVPFVPASNLFFHVGFVVAERILYVPSVGFCLLAALSVDALARISGKPVAWSMLIISALLLSARTWVRNDEWDSDFNIHQAAVRDNPLNIKVVTNFGLLQHNRARDAALPDAERQKWMQRAEATYKQALAIDPHYSAAGFDLGNLYYEQGRFDEAIQVFQRALEKSDYTKTPIKILTNLATVMYRKGQPEEAEKYFKAALQMEPNHLQALNGLGSIYGQQKRYTESKAAFERALAADPGYVEGHFNYGTLLYTMGNKDEAEKELKEALRLNPGHAGAANNLKVIEYDRQKQRGA